MFSQFQCLFVCLFTSTSLSNLCHPQEPAFWTSASALIGPSTFLLFLNILNRIFWCQQFQTNLLTFVSVKITHMFRHVAGMQCTRLGRFSRYPTGWESPLLAFSFMRWSLVGISLLLIIRLGYHQGYIGTSQGSNWDKSAHQGPTWMLWGLSLCVIRLSSWLHYQAIIVIGLSGYHRDCIITISPSQMQL